MLLLMIIITHHHKLEVGNRSRNPRSTKNKKSIKFKEFIVAKNQDNIYTNMENKNLPKEKIQEVPLL